MAVIVGAGPSGLLLAHLLLSHASDNDIIRGLLPIRIYEARDDPRIPLPLYKSRQYVVGLSARGRDAISRVDGLWDVVKTEGVPSSQFVLHLGGRSIALKRNPDKPSLLVNQRSLAAVLVRELEERYSKEQVQVNYGARCIGADFNSHTVRFQSNSKEDVVPYDLLVGADGARSVVREAFIRERGFDFQQKNMPYTFKVLYAPRPPELGDDAVHTFRVSKQDSEGNGSSWLSNIPNPFARGGKKKPSKSISFGCFPTPNSSMSVLLSWSSDSVPQELLQIQSASELKSYIEKYMPPLKVPVEAAEAFISQRPTTSMQIHCSRFYDARGKAVLVGDAAHAMSNALGQGCNSSLKVQLYTAMLLQFSSMKIVLEVLLQDVEALERMLVQERSIASAIEKYSEQQVKEDHAAAYVSEHAFPQANWLRPAYLLSNIVSAGLSKTPLSPLISPSIQSLCSETLTPYSEIARRHNWWLKFVEVTNVLASAKGPSS